MYGRLLLSQTDLWNWAHHDGLRSAPERLAKLADAVADADDNGFIADPFDSLAQPE